MARALAIDVKMLFRLGIIEMLSTNLSIPVILRGKGHRFDSLLIPVEVSLS